MPFALLTVRLLDVLQKPGCPICRQMRISAEQSMDTFLWENVNAPDVRRPVIAAFGFCPEHARLLVSRELSTHGVVLGTNIIYEQLSRRTGERVATLKPGITSWFQNFLNKFGIHRSHPQSSILAARGRCMMCDLAEQAAANSLNTLFAELEKDAADVMAAYQNSDGLCLNHLRDGLECNARQHSHAAKLLITWTSDRLAKQSTAMQEYIRKNNWQYRDEALTPEEANAWRKSLTFFTGLPDTQFTFKKDDF